MQRREFLQRSALLGVTALDASWSIFSPRDAQAADDEPFDVLISGGTIIDGTGAAPVRGDVGIRQGRIDKVGTLGSAPSKRRVNATGKIIAPGFIDMHSHSDRTLMTDGQAQSSIRQGCTTLVTGNCGSSPAPLVDPTTVNKQTFRTYGEYLQALKQSQTSVNVAGLVGHNTVRMAVMGMQNRPPTEVELRKMQDFVAEAMAGGAVGLSTGLVTPPGTWSTTSEIVELARVVGKAGGIYATHMRGEAGTLVESVREALQVGREGKLRVQISHHKAAGKENWGKTRQTLPMIEAANREGHTVRVDVYPYRAGSAGLSQLVPPWAHEGGNGEMLGRLKDPESRKRIAHEMTVGPDAESGGLASWPNFFVIDWDDIQITSVVSQANRQWVGKKVGDVARARKCSGTDACIDLLLEERGSVGMINFIMDEDEVRRMLAHPLSMIGSDGVSVSAATPQGSPHPRFYGCFPRVLGHYCRDLKLFPIETAIYKTTGMPAEQLGLPDRGVIRPGAAADIVVFNFDTVIDKATFEQPHQYPVGIEVVLVNGVIVVAEGEHTGALPGQIVSPRRV